MEARKYIKGGVKIQSPGCKQALGSLGRPRTKLHVHRCQYYNMHTIHQVTSRRNTKAYPSHRGGEYDLFAHRSRHAMYRHEMHLYLHACEQKSPRPARQYGGETLKGMDKISKHKTCIRICKAQKTRMAIVHTLLSGISPRLRSSRLPRKAMGMVGRGGRGEEERGVCESALSAKFTTFSQWFRRAAASACAQGSMGE